MNEQLPKDELFSDFAPCCQGPEAGVCACGFQERALRAVIAGEYRPMSQPERDWCKQEIAHVEGYSESDAEGSDADVARTVLHAWTDYARDKGLL
jgi:hypothetical protein